MTASQQENERQARARRALTHFHFAMAYLSVGDVPSADDYVQDVRSRDGDEMYRSVLDMIAVHTHTPLES